MASSNKTASFALNQWEPDDQVMREDFNRDNQLLDEALNKATFITGTYTGTGTSNTRAVSLGFKPSVLLVGPALSHYSNSHSCILTTAAPTANYVELTASGFTVKNELNRSTSEQNGNSINPFRYIAWK